jgi:serine/threonine protein kinase/Tfp pilus assembly protein PilF
VATVSMRDHLNAVLGDRYTVEREIGSGGMASVWLARDLRHERLVAIKVLHPDLAGAIGVDRFVREIRLTARLQHPNIIPVLDSGTLPGPDGVTLPWYAMSYVVGESLRSRLELERFLPIEEALRITEEAASALEAAHREGIIHRDIKPENVLLADGRVYVADFGVAKILMETGAERLTNTGLAIGTPTYMSPEQGTAEAIDARSDQYSLACVLYEMLAGEPPFTGPTAQAILARRASEPARQIRRVRSSVPGAVEAAVLRALERIPTDRFPDISSFATALRDTAPTASPRSGRPKLGKHWRVAAGAALLVAVMMGIWSRFGTTRGLERSVADPEVVALSQRGVRAYDRRSAAGSAEAITAFSAAVKRDSTYSPAWNGLAKTYLRAYERPFPLPGVTRDNTLRLALAAVQHALASDSSSADVWLTQALLSRDVDPTDNAPVLRSLQHAIALDSTDARVWHFLALTRAELADFSGAVSAWRRSVKLDPTYTQGLVFLGIGHYMQRQYDSARVWTDSAVALDPNYVLGRGMVGYVATERGDYDRALASFEAAQRLSNDVEALNALAGSALAEARAGRKSEARARLRVAESQAKAYEPTPLHPAVFVAHAYAALGDVDHAVEWLARFQPRASLHFQLHLRCDPPFDSIRNDARFQSLLIRPASSARDCR